MINWKLQWQSEKKFDCAHLEELNVIPLQATAAGTGRPSRLVNTALPLVPAPGLSQPGDHPEVLELRYAFAQGNHRAPSCRSQCCQEAWPTGQRSTRRQEKSYFHTSYEAKNTSFFTHHRAGACLSCNQLKNNENVLTTYYKLTEKFIARPHWNMQRDL